MSNHRIVTTINERGYEKHYPQFRHMWFWWSPYVIGVPQFTGEELSHIRNAISRIESKFTNFAMSFSAKDSLYFYTFDQAHQFIRFVEYELPKLILRDNLKKAEIEAKRQVIIRPVNLKD
jgi:hypothetical protein